MKNEILNKPNQLVGIKSDKPVTTIQRKIYNVLLKVVQKELKFIEPINKVSVDKAYTFEVDADVVHGVAGVKIKDLEYIYEELRSLASVTVTVRGEDNPDNWKTFSILPQITKEDGLYRFILVGTVVKALQEQNYFTTLDLLMIQSLTSQYSVIFYELATRYKKYKIPKMTIEKVREITNAQNKYSRFEAFRRRVLDTACEEISDKTDVILSYNTEKKGRKITHIDFEVKKKNIKEELPTPEESIKEIFSDEVEELYKLLPLEVQSKSSKRTLDKLLKKHKFKYLKGDIEYAKKQNPQNFMGYFKKSCERCEEVGACGEGGHYSSTVVERVELEKKRIQKRKIEEQERKRLEGIRKEKIKNKAIEIYKDLSEEELDEYNDEYNRMAKFVPENIRPDKKEYIVGSLEDELEDKVDLDIEDYK